MIKKVGVQFILALVFLFGINTCLIAQPGNLPAPYCMPLYGQSPCNQPGPSNMPGNFLNDFIHSVLTFSGNVDINNPNTGCNAQIFPSIGIKNYIYHKCQHNLSVSAGQVVSFSIQIGNINPQGVAAFIDWNNDNIFSTAPTEKIGWSTGTVPAGGWLTFTTTIPPAQTNGTYRLRVRCAFGISGATIDPCNNYSCGEVEDYDVYVGTTSPVISNVVASSNSTLCSGNTLSLNLTYTSQCSPSYTWAGPNSFVSNSQNPTIVNAQPLHSGNYSLTVTCGTACPVSLTTSVTVVQGPTPANAGGNQCICATTATLNGNIPSIGTGSWTLLSGSAIIITPTLANTALFSVGVGTNIFAWTITNGTCVSSSTVAIIRGMPPSVSVAGPNQTLTCSGNTTTMQANAPAIGIGTWSLISGSGILYHLIHQAQL
ncbi:MAG: immunoglobulin domain-containing protein [Sphingobacteriaceae bacterium]|nr:immunoglobulin domain-containing protein [Sphingobacteriaceae bacterium]